jgi:hypothetical protein
MHFLMVTQFYEYGGGSVFQVAATANGVTYDPSTPIAQPVASGSSTAKAASATSNTNGALSSAPFGRALATVPVVATALMLGAASVF